MPSMIIMSDISMGQKDFFDSVVSMLEYFYTHPFLSITPVCFYAQNIFMLTNTDRSAFSMLMSVGFYALEHLYARIPMFLYTHLIFLCSSIFLYFVSLCFYAHVKL